MMDELDMTPGGSRAGLATPSYRAHQRSAGMDPATRRLAMIAGGLGGGLLLLVGGWSLTGHHSGPVPVIEADKTPMRVKPDNPGGMQVAGANDDILSGDAGGQTPSLAPAPEKPDPQALRAQTPPATPQAAPPAPTKPAAPKQVAAKPTAGAPAPAAGPTASVAAAGAGTPQPVLHGPQVQLGSLVSEQAAHDEWQRLTRRMPDLLGHRRPAVAKAEVNGRTFWRLRTDGFADAAQATSFCEQVRAKGGGCSVASF